MMNFANRTIWTGDNLDILRGLNSDTVDLIYLDPPFNSNRNYEAPVGSKAAGAAFKDTWTLSDLDVAWMGLIADEQPAVARLLDAARWTHGKGMQSYLTMMAVRLLEMRRVLKDTGSIYLHCDDTASHYLKQLMDAVFGPAQFRNHIVWRRATAHNDPKQFGRNVDHILYYAKGQRWTWNGRDIATPKSEAEVRKAYPQIDRSEPVGWGVRAALARLRRSWPRPPLGSPEERRICRVHRGAFHPRLSQHQGRSRPA